MQRESGGTSDARFVKDYCPVLEFGPTNATIHQTDERISVDELKAALADGRLKKPLAKSGEKATAPVDRFANNKLFTADKVAAARERMKKKLEQKE